MGGTPGRHIRGGRPATANLERSIKMVTIGILGVAALVGCGMIIGFCLVIAFDL